MNLKEYFERTAYQAVYEIGTPCSGVYQGIPFRGTIFNDTLVSLEEGPYVTVHLALPIVIEDREITVIKCAHKDIKVVNK